MVAFHRSTVRLAIAGLAALAIPFGAQAQERPTGTYVGGAGGINIGEDTELDGTGLSRDLGLDNGIAGILSLGQSYANGMRAEAEFNYRRNGVDDGGSVKALGPMLNVYYDFVNQSALIPYLGLGVGAGRVTAIANPIGSSSVNDSGWGVALQGIAGVGYQLTENWAGTLEYRYYTVPDAGLKAASGVSLDADYASHAVMVGLRYTFGVEKPQMPVETPAPAPVAEKKPAPPPPPPPPPPAPEITRNFIVFFDWDRAEITPEAQAILRSAAENAKKGNISRIEATGHADRSGTQKYNLRLSERRALAVQKALAGLGISAGEVAVDFKGELQPLVPTADGVREPQNRRVEIVFP